MWLQFVQPPPSAADWRWDGRLRSGATQSGLVLLDEWELITNRGRDDVAEALREDSEHGHDMRQQSPVAGLLSDRERWSILEQVYGKPMPHEWWSAVTDLQPDVSSENLLAEKRGRG